MIEWLTSCHLCPHAETVVICCRKRELIVNGWMGTTGIIMGKEVQIPQFTELYAVRHVTTSPSRVMTKTTSFSYTTFKVSLYTYYCQWKIRHCWIESLIFIYIFSHNMYSYSTLFNHYIIWTWIWACAVIECCSSVCMLLLQKR